MRSASPSPFTLTQESPIFPCFLCLISHVSRGEDVPQIVETRKRVDKIDKMPLRPCLHFWPISSNMYCSKLIFHFEFNDLTSHDLSITSIQLLFVSIGCNFESLSSDLQFVGRPAPALGLHNNLHLAGRLRRVREIGSGERVME